MAPCKKIDLNFMHDESNNILSSKINSSISEQEKLSKTITEYSEDEENERSNHSLEKPSPEKNRQDYMNEFKVFNESTNMLIEEKNFSLIENNLQKNNDTAKFSAQIANEYNFSEISQNNKIFHKNINFPIFSSNKIRDKSHAERNLIFETSKDDKCKQEDRYNKTDLLFYNNITANLNDYQSSNSLIVKNFNISQSNNVQKEIPKKHFLIKENISESNNAKHNNNFASNQPEKVFFAEKEENKIFKNLELKPSNVSSNIDTINPDNENEIYDENSVRFSIQKNSVNGKKHNNNLKTGRWTNEEHISFLEAIFLYNNNWKKVQHHIRTRSSTQARSHAQKFFITLKKKILQDLNNPTEEEINNEKNRIYLEESIETLFINKIYCGGLQDKDFFGKKNKLLDLIKTLLFSNAKNKKSFFKCIDYKEHTTTRRDSIKILKMRAVPDSINSNDSNLNNSSILNRFFRKNSLDESKALINNEISNNTLKNSNSNLLLELSNSMGNNINFNAGNLSKPNVKSSFFNKSGMAFQGYSNNSGDNNCYDSFNLSEIKTEDKKRSCLDLNINKLNNNVILNNKPIDNKFTTSNINNICNSNQTLFLSQSYTLNKNGNFEMNNENNHQANIGKEILLSNNKIEDLSLKSIIKKDSNQKSNKDLIHENINNKSDYSNYSILNDGVYSSPNKDLKENYNNNLKFYKHDPITMYNTENINMKREMKKNVKNIYSKFINNNFVVGNKVDKNFISNDLTIREEEKPLSNNIKYDLMNNKISDFNQEQLKESFVYKDNNLFRTQNKIGLGKTMSYVENRDFEKYNIETDVDNNYNNYLNNNRSVNTSNLKIMRAYNSSPVNTNNNLHFSQQKEVSKYSNNSLFIKSPSNSNTKDNYNLCFNSMDYNLNSDKKLKIIKNPGNFIENVSINNPSQINTININYAYDNYQNASHSNITNRGKIISYGNRIEKFPEKEAFTEKSIYSNYSKNLETFDMNDIERSNKNSSDQNNKNKAKNHKNNLYNFKQISIENNEDTKMKFHSLNFDLVQDISKNIKSYYKTKKSDLKTPTSSHNSNLNSNKNFNNLYSDNNQFNKSRFLQIFNHNISNSDEKGININQTINDNLHNIQRHINDKVLDKNFINVLNNQDLSKNKLLSNKGILNKDANLDNYSKNTYQKPIQNEAGVNDSFNGSIDRLNIFNNEFKNKGVFKLNNDLSFNKHYHNNQSSYQKDNYAEYINQYCGDENDSRHFLHHSKNFKNNNFRNLNNNNFINILNINVVHPKETNSNPSTDMEIPGKQETISNKNSKEYKNTTTFNNEPMIENKNPIPKWINQETQVFNSIPNKINLITSPENLFFKSKNIENIQSNLSKKLDNNNNDDNIITTKDNIKTTNDNIITTNANIKNINIGNSNLISNIFTSSSKKINNSNDSLSCDLNKTDFYKLNIENKNISSSKMLIEENNYSTNSISMENNYKKRVYKESSDVTLNPFNLNFLVEEDKRLIGNVSNNDCFNSYLNNEREEDEFLLFDMFPN